MAKTCSRCGVEFTIFLWRHICRRCKKAFCASCSPYKRPIPKLNIATPSRVCYYCNIFLALEACDRAFLKTLSIHELSDFAFKNLHINIHHLNLLEKDEILDFIIIHYAEECNKRKFKENNKRETEGMSPQTFQSDNGKSDINSSSHTSTTQNNNNFRLGDVSVNATSSSSQSSPFPYININFGSVGQVLFSVNSSSSSQVTTLNERTTSHSTLTNAVFATSNVNGQSSSPTTATATATTSSSASAPVNDTNNNIPTTDLENGTQDIVNSNATDLTGATTTIPVSGSTQRETCDLNTLPVAELKAILKRHKIDYSDCVEKRDLVDKIKEFVGEDTIATTPTAGTESSMLHGGTPSHYLLHVFCASSIVLCLQVQMRGLKMKKVNLMKYQKRNFVSFVSKSRSIPFFWSAATLWLAKNVASNSNNVQCVDAGYRV
jgi:hypothetical protein